MDVMVMVKTSASERATCQWLIWLNCLSVDERASDYRERASARTLYVEYGGQAVVRLQLPT